MQEYIQQAALREKRVDAVRDTFHALDNAKARERVSLQPGEHLIAGAALLHCCTGSASDPHTSRLSCFTSNG
jgi:hypothetical protein